MNLWFNNIIKSVEFMSLTSNEVDEATTGQYKQGIHRSIVLQEASGQRWLVKPALSEHLSSWRKVPPNRCYVREIGAFVISNAMKLGLVPETKLINYDDQVGSAQKWIEAKPFETMEIFNEIDVWLAGIFDLLIGQLDRHKGNVLIDNQNMPVLIDNGYCLSGDTSIKLLDGTFDTMEELSKRTENYWVYGMDKTGKIVPSLATPARITGENVPIYEVVLDNGESVKATANHLFLMRNNTYKELSELVVGDSLMPLYWKYATKVLEDYELIAQPANGTNKNNWHYTHDERGRFITQNGAPNNHKIIMIKFIGIVDKVYDVTTTTHNFGLSAGIFVHNSMPFTIADKSKNIIVSRFAYEIWDKPLPSWLLNMLEATPWDKVRRELYDKRLFGRNAAAVDLFFKRLKFIQETGKASIPKFSVTRRLLHNSK